MKTLPNILIAVLLAVGALPSRAADKPATQQQPPAKEQAKKEKPQDKPSGNQRRTQIPET